MASQPEGGGGFTEVAKRLGGVQRAAHQQPWIRIESSHTFVYSDEVVSMSSSQPHTASEASGVFASLSSDRAGRFPVFADVRRILFMHAEC